MLITRNGQVVGYLFLHEGVAYSPGGCHGQLTKDEVDAHNAALSQAEIAGLEKCEIGQCGTFYAKLVPFGKANVSTWIGEHISTGHVEGRTITFHRRMADGTMGCFRGRLRKDSDAFYFKRIR